MQNESTRSGPTPAPSARQARKQRESDTRRKTIIEVVRELIRAGRMGDVTLRRVAGLAGFSTTVVYSLFGDKASLILHALDEDLLELARVLQACAAADSPPLERLRAAGHAYIRFGLEHPAEYSFVFMQRRPQAPDAASLMRQGDPTQDPYAFARAAMNDLAAAYRLSSTDIDLMTQIFWEGLHGLTSRRLVNGPEDVWVPELPNERHADKMIDVLLRGILCEFAISY
jgi:AcrR family transcriptional regulator